MSTYKTKTVSLLTLNSSKLSWLLAKHICPCDEPVLYPHFARAAANPYNFISGDDLEMKFLGRAVEDYKVSVIWRPWLGSQGKWFACVEGDPLEGEVWGIANPNRNKAIVLALVAHLENAMQTMAVELPEVLL